MREIALFLTHILWKLTRHSAFPGGASLVRAPGPDYVRRCICGPALFYPVVGPDQADELVIPSQPREGPVRVGRLQLVQHEIGRNHGGLTVQEPLVHDPVDNAGREGVHKLGPQVVNDQEVAGEAVPEILGLVLELRLLRHVIQ